MFEHIISGGCSFTADGIGGLPPSATNAHGGCSFIDDGHYGKTQPRSWVGHVAKDLKVKSLVNLAADSHGNIALASNIMGLISRFTYDPKTTLILFNLSDPGRLDVMCDILNPYRSQYVPWKSKILPWTYLSMGSNIQKKIASYYGIDQIEYLTSYAVQGLLSFLENKKFHYRFLMMNDYTKHAVLGDILQNFNSKMICLDPGPDMKKFVADKKLNTIDNIHPDSQGHRAIADLVLKTLASNT